MCAVHVEICCIIPAVINFHTQTASDNLKAEDVKQKAIKSELKEQKHYTEFH